MIFALYTTPYSSMISAYTIPHHLYADDSQPYVSFASGEWALALFTVVIGLCGIIDFDE